MFGWLLQAFKAAAPGIASYFIASEAGSAVLDKIIPESIAGKVKQEDGTFKPWFVIVLFVIVGGLIALVVGAIMKMLPKSKGKKGMFFSLAALLAYVGLIRFVDSDSLVIALGGLGSFFSNSDSSYYLQATVLTTLTTGVGVNTNATLNFMPERIYFSAATQLSGIKISTRDNGTIWDSDAAGITHAGLLRVYGQVTNGYVLTLANDLIESGSVFFQFTNSAAQTPIIYYDSDLGVGADEERFMQMGQVQLLVGGNKFSNFKALHLPNLGANDVITIAYADGRVQTQHTRVDLQYKLGATQVVVNTPLYTIDNLAGDILSVNVNVAVQQTGYVQRYVPTIGLIEPNMN